MRFSHFWKVRLLREKSKPTRFGVLMEFQGKGLLSEGTGAQVDSLITAVLSCTQHKAGFVRPSSERPVPMSLETKASHKIGFPGSLTP